MEIRNIAIIAHVDHGKTKLTDAILEQTGAAKIGASMDNNALEKERGITIYSKNAAVIYKGTKINIVDTPTTLISAQKLSEYFVQLILCFYL